MSERDPRIDPQPGDRLRRGTRPTMGDIREVTHRTNQGGVSGKTDHPIYTHFHFRTLDNWRSWAKDAEVLPPAADAGGTEEVARLP